MKEEPDSLSVPYNFARCFNDTKTLTQTTYYYINENYPIP